MTYLTDNLARWARYELPSPAAAGETSIVSAHPVAADEKPPIYTRSPALRAEIMRVWDIVCRRMSSKKDDVPMPLPPTEERGPGVPSPASPRPHATGVDFVPAIMTTPAVAPPSGGLSGSDVSAVMGSPLTPAAVVGSAGDGDGSASRGGTASSQTRQSPPGPPRQLGLLVQQQQPDLLHPGAGGDGGAGGVGRAAAAAGASAAESSAKYGPVGAELKRGSSAPPLQDQQSQKEPENVFAIAAAAPPPPALVRRGDDGVSARDARGRVPIDTVRRFVARVTGPFPAQGTSVEEIQRYFAGWVEPGMLYIHVFGPVRSGPIAFAVSWVLYAVFGTSSGWDVLEGRSESGLD